jgi:hypothetical protein
MQTYGKITQSAAEGVISNWLAIEKRARKLGELTKDEIKSEVTKYEDAMTKVHNYVLRETKELFKQSLKHAAASRGGSSSSSSKSAGTGEDGEEEDNASEEKSKPTKKRTRRPKTDVTSLGLDVAPPKKVEASPELAEKMEQLVNFLNEKYGSETRSYKVDDSAKKVYARIVRVDDDKESTHCLIVKDDHQRKREVKPKTCAPGPATTSKVTKKSDHDEVRVFNAEEGLVSLFKMESVKAGDVLKGGNGNSASPIPVPSVRGNILTDYDNTVLKMSEYSVNLDVVQTVKAEAEEAEGAEGGEGEAEPEAEVQQQNSNNDEAEAEAEAEEEPEEQEQSTKKKKRTTQPAEDDDE